MLDMFPLQSFPNKRNGGNLRVYILLGETDNDKMIRYRTAGSDGKESVSNTGDPSLVPGSGRSPEEGNSSPLQYPCLENPMDRGAWQATVGVANRQG